MKRIKLISFYLIFFVLFLNLNSYCQDFSSVYSFYKQYDYFHFRNAVDNLPADMPSWQCKYLTSLSDGVFGKFENSKLLITDIIKNNGIPDSLLKDIYQIKYYDHIFSFEYKDAYDCAKMLLMNFSEYLTEDEKRNFKDEIDMLESMKDAPPQKISKSGELKLKIKKDMAGLWNVPVSFGENSYDFVFDTGADYSVVVESMAKKLNLQVSDKTFEVGTSTDKRVTSKIAIAKLFRIGNITFEYVVLLVMKDEDFTFGPYKIEGVIGAPIIRALGEIKLTKEKMLIVPELPEISDWHNFAYSGYTPIIQMIYGNDSLEFVFDSGNNSVELFSPFFKKYSGEITAKYKLQKINTGGAGGIIETDGYIIDKINLKTGNSNADLIGVPLLINELSDNHKYFHGNLGQQYIQQFDTLIMNYANMYIEFK